MPPSAFLELAVGCDSGAIAARATARRSEVALREITRRLARMVMLPDAQVSLASNYSGSVTGKEESTSGTRTVQMAHTATVSVRARPSARARQPG